MNRDGRGKFWDNSSILHLLCTLFLLLLHQFHPGSSGIRSRRLGIPTLEHSLTGCQRCALSGSFSRRGPGPPGQVQLCGSRSRAQGPVQRLCTRPAATILNWASCTGSLLAAQADVSGSPFTLGTLVWSARCEASAWSTLRARETRLSTKEKKVRLYFLTQVLFLFPGIVHELFRWYGLFCITVLY